MLNETPERLAARWPAAFDRVAVDAPCSGEGMFRKNDEARYHWSEAHVAGCALRQRGILDTAAQLVRPGGRLVYATCTFAPEEDEGVIWRFLDHHPDFEVVQPPWQPGFATGRPEWAEWPAVIAEAGTVDATQARVAAHGTPLAAQAARRGSFRGGHAAGRQRCAGALVSGTARTAGAG